MRYGAWAGCGAHSESTSSIASPPPRQPLLSGHKNDWRALVRPKTPKLVGEGPRALDARRRRSPDRRPCRRLLAHRNSPHAGPRSLPTSAWIGFALLYSRLPEKGTKLKPWGAAMIKIKNKTMGLMPRLGAIQWCRLRRDLPSRSLAPAMGTKGGGLAF